MTLIWMEISVSKLSIQYLSRIQYIGNNFQKLYAPTFLAYVLKESKRIIPAVNQ